MENLFTRNTFVTEMYVLVPCTVSLNVRLENQSMPPVNHQKTKELERCVSLRLSHYDVSRYLGLLGQSTWCCCTTNCQYP